MRTAGAALAAASVILLSLADGGYEQRAWHAAAILLACAAGIAVVIRAGVSASRSQWLVLASLAALAGWMALSRVWSPDPAAASLEAQRALVYVALAGAAIAVGGRLRDGALVGIGAACAYSLGDRLLNGPSVLSEGLLHEPLGYANALGGLAAIGVAAAAGGIACGRRARPHWLLLAALGLATLALTQSRGGWFAAGAGVAVAVSLGLGRLGAAKLAAAAAAALIATGLALAATPLADDLARRAGDRPLYWHVAWKEAAAAPLVGRGAGTFELAWVQRGPVEIDVRDAHSVYLETLAELGVVGLALLLCALAPPLAIALRGPVAAPAAAAGAGAYVAFVVHAGIDWDWEMPAVTVAGLFCGASLIAQVWVPRNVLQEVPTEGASR